jgi:hypothetical protein
MVWTAILLAHEAARRQGAMQPPRALGDRTDILRGNDRLLPNFLSPRTNRYGGRRHLRMQEDRMAPRAGLEPATRRRTVGAIPSISCVGVTEHQQVWSAHKGPFPPAMPATMSDSHDPVAEAVAALIAAGYMVEQFVEPPELWLVDGEIMTEGALLDEAIQTAFTDG